MKGRREWSEGRQGGRASWREEKRVEGVDGAREEVRGEKVGEGEGRVGGRR